MGPASLQRSSEVVRICLVYGVGDYVIRLVIFREAKDLDVLRIGNHNSLLVELKRLSEALDTPLTEANVLVPNLSPSLEQRCHGATLNNSHLDRLGLLLLANRAG